MWSNDKPVIYIFSKQSNHNVSFCSKHSSVANTLLYLPVQCQVLKTLAVHCCCYVCTAAGRHSAGCRMSWVCLQHHVTVLTSNGVTIYGGKFPPTVSKHCQHQHSAIPKTIQAIWNTTIPDVVISKVLLPQTNIMGAFVFSHCIRYSDDPPGLPTYTKPNVTQCADNLLRPMPKMSDCQHPVHKI
jgi:hypothetical protein